MEINDLDIKFRNFLTETKKVNPNSNLDILSRAWEFAKIAHAGQKRYSGEPYVSHLLDVAIILLGWNMDIKSLVAGILHDVTEDGGAKHGDIAQGFGDEVALLVDGVSKVSRVQLRGSLDSVFIENLRKMFVAMAKDLRVVLIKLADRLHNMRTLNFVPDEKKKRIANETLQIYAPLADRLGMGQAKAELEDLAFPYVFPEEYKKVKELSQNYYKTVDKEIDKIRKQLLTALAQRNIRANIQSRSKHLYSLWKKLCRADINWDFDKIHDIVAARIILDTVEQCYATLGIIHNLYKPVPYLGISDFIAQPKPNGYKSIHTKVFGPGGRIIEIQIRTHQMHQEDEYGLAAHWAYNELKNQKVNDRAFVYHSSDKLKWVKQLVDWQKKIKDSEEYIKAVKSDILNERIFAFTPKGDVYDLPKGATPIDFAYSVHTDLGNYLKGAKVNGKIVPLNNKLDNGDVVEILKDKNPKKPTEKWMDFAITTNAKRHIKRRLKSDP